MTPLAHPIAAPSSLPLSQALQARLGPLPGSVQALVDGAAQARSLRTGEALLRAGEHWRQLCWVHTGALRLYYLDRQGQAANKNFHLAGALLWPLTPALAAEPVDFWIEALGPTRLWCLPWADWQQAVGQWPQGLALPAPDTTPDNAPGAASAASPAGQPGPCDGVPAGPATAPPVWPAWSALVQQTLAALLDDKMRREQQFLQCTATQRYQALCSERPDWLAQVPLRHLASYLGITDVALSRIRRRLRG